MISPDDRPQEPEAEGSTKPWEVALRHPGRRTEGRISLLYEGRPITSSVIGYTAPVLYEGKIVAFEPDPDRLAYFRVMAKEYNRRGWEPTYTPWIMKAARILADALEGVNGRKVSHVKGVHGGYTVACHPGALFWYSKSLRLKAFQLDTSDRYVADEEAQEAFRALIDQAALSERVADMQLRLKRLSPKEKKTRRDAELVELSDRLADWHERNRKEEPTI